MRPTRATCLSNETHTSNLPIQCDPHGQPAYTMRPTRATCLCNAALTGILPVGWKWWLLISDKPYHSCCPINQTHSCRKVQFRNWASFYYLCLLFESGWGNSSASTMQNLRWKYSLWCVLLCEQCVDSSPKYSY